MPSIGIGNYIKAYGAAASASVPEWWESDEADTILAYQPIGAASLAASYVNLSNPGAYDAALGTAPSFAAATGWTFNGTNQYLNTQWSPRTNRNVTVMMRVTPVTSLLNDSFFGAVMGSGDWAGLEIKSGTRFVYQNGGFFGTDEGSVITAGNNYVVGIAGSNAYLNGVSEDVSIGGSASDVTRTLFIAARNYGSANQFQNCVCQAFAVFNGVLSAPEMAAKSVLMAALS